MFSLARSVPLFLRLFFIFAWATIIPIIVIGVLGVSYFGALQTSSRAVQASNQALKITTDSQANLQSMHALLVALLPGITNNVANSSSFQSEKQVIFQVLSIEGSFDIDSVQYQENYQLATAAGAADIRTILVNNHLHTSLISQQQQLLDDILLHQWPQYKVAQDHLLIGLETHVSLAEAAVDLQNANALYAPVSQNWQKIVDNAENVNAEVVSVGPSQINPIIFGTISAIVISMFVVFAIGFLVNQTITRPLYHLVGLTRRITDGEIAARSGLRGNDEIAKVALSMDAMLDHIVQLMQEARSGRDYLTQRVEKLITEVKGIGEGNLRIHMEVTGDALGVLARSFNRMIDDLGDLVVRVKRVARDVDRSTSAMLEQNSNLVRIGDEQLKQIFLLNIDVESMAKASREVAKHGQSLYNIATYAYQSASDGRHDVQQVIDKISNINQNVQTTARKVQLLGEVSQEINSIAEVISGIAYQTNRLALDSAIQAATSGTSGQGFSIVVSDIRKLAEQTKERAANIGRIVRDVREDINAVAVSMQNTEREALSSTNAVKDIGEALAVIFEVVKRQSEESVSINQLASQQLQSANRVVHSMHSTSDTTRQNNTHINDAVHHIQQLTHLVEQLRLFVEVFKLHDDLHDGNSAAASSTTPHQSLSTDSTRTLARNGPVGGREHHVPLSGHPQMRTPFPVDKDVHLKSHH